MVKHDTRDYNFANLFLNYMWRQRTFEIARCYMTFRSQYMLYVKPLWDHHIEMGDLDRATPTKQLYWDDASKTVGYVEYVVQRVSKYGMEIVFILY